jgi:hypothetical protein
MKTEMIAHQVTEQFPAAVPCLPLRQEHYEEGFQENEQSIRDFGTGEQDVMQPVNHTEPDET